MKGIETIAQLIKKNKKDCYTNLNEKDAANKEQIWWAVNAFYQTKQNLPRKLLSCLVEGEKLRLRIQKML